MIKKGAAITTIACTVTIILNSCCKADCINRSLFISFNKLRAIDTDSVSFLSYTAGTNFTQRTDSTFVLYPVAASDTSFSNLFRDLFAGFDWKIINHSLNREYRLNNFEIAKVKCCSDRAYVVRSFQLNGVSNSGSHLLIE